VDLALSLEESLPSFIKNILGHHFKRLPTQQEMAVTARRLERLLFCDASGSTKESFEVCL